MFVHLSGMQQEINPGGIMFCVNTSDTAIGMPNTAYNANLI